MIHQVLLDVPDEVYQPLLRKAAESGRSLEAVAAECLAQAVQTAAPESPARKWAGALASGVTDASTRHDHYLGQALAEDLQSAPHD